MYIYPKNTIDIYAWTLYTPINDFICYALNPFVYGIYLDSTSLDVHLPGTTIDTPIDDNVSCIRPGGSANI